MTTNQIAMGKIETPSFTRATTRTVGRARPGTKSLWTIQPLRVWGRLCEQRTLLSDPMEEAFFQDFRDSYDWMRDQMRRRLPEYHGHYPWWACEHKPNLRHQIVGPSSVPFVRLELALPPERVLLSAYGAWHYVLNHWYLPQTIQGAEYEREEVAWEEELKRHGLDTLTQSPLPEPWHTRMTTSWERIFDVTDLRESNTIQACFEYLEREEVVKATVFTPRPLPRNQHF